MRVFTDKRIFLYTQTLCMQVMYGIPVTQTRLLKRFSDLFEIKYTDLFILLHFIEHIPSFSIAKNLQFTVFEVSCSSSYKLCRHGNIDFAELFRSLQSSIQSQYWCKFKFLIDHGIGETVVNPCDPSTDSIHLLKSSSAYLKTKTMRSPKTTARLTQRNIFQDSFGWPNIVLKYITLCQLCSSLWTSHRLFSKFGWLDLL